jgi:hypothetical protein
MIRKDRVMTVFFMILKCENTIKINLNSLSCPFLEIFYITSMSVVIHYILLEKNGMIVIWHFKRRSHFESIK